MLDLKQDYFALFGLTPAFALEGERLESAYREIQARVHPDRHAHLSDAEKRLAMQWATHANEAFRTLRSPLLRGAYLLSLQGVDPQFETNTARIWPLQPIPCAVSSFSTSCKTKSMTP